MIKRAALLVLKVAFLVFFGYLTLLQLREIRYDLGPKTPVPIAGPEDLDAASLAGSTFAAVRGSGNFKQGFRYRRYGLTYTYFTLDPYGPRVVVRTYEAVVDEEGNVKDDWRKIHTFIGRLRPFARQPFSYRIRQYYKQHCQIDIPADACFLAYLDLPKPDAWQIGAFIFGTLLWLAMVYFFFIFKWKKPTTPPDAA